MSHLDVADRPAKKRRFFVEDSPLIERTFSPEDTKVYDDALVDATGVHIASRLKGQDHSSKDTTQKNPPPTIPDAPGLDADLFATVVGEEVSASTLRKIEELSGNDLLRAINIYFDGSWKATGLPHTQKSSSVETWARKPQSSSWPDAAMNSPPKSDKPLKNGSLSSMPESRYVGAFGVTGWATRSGSGLVKSGDTVDIERQKPQGITLKGGRGGKVRATMSKKQDIVVRFTNSRGQEVGRLENESAAWISTLLDQRVCRFSATCIYAPETLRTNDNIYLQLKCYILRVAFEGGGFVKPEDNREAGRFEPKESEDERRLRLRQVALVKMFDEINLQPSRINSTAREHKRQGILQAAEIAEHYEPNQASKTDAGSTSRKADADSSSPPSEDAEDGKELEQDQLDSLYKKAQTFDFDTPEYEPASTFNMKLRKYQKQALHWMISKETNAKAEDRETSMHPLWEEYRWPEKDFDDKDLPEIINQPNFYVNPYSGELSLDFPVQEQNCLGGILADEMGLGKTIEMMSLIHSHRAVSLPVSANSSSMHNLPRLPKASSSIENAPCTTLVVAPMSLLSQWQSEAEKASKEGTLRVMVYYGAEKSANLQNLCCEANSATAPNVIVTSYGTVLSEFNAVASNGGNRGSHGGLFSVEYFRVILDEAHQIKNRQAKTSKACYEISAKHRWVLTGTPIVNRLEDLFSLVHFLKVEPWSNFSFWKTFITVPFESGDFVRALNVVQTVLEPLVMRRTKDMKTPSGEALVSLPAKTINIDKVELSEEERGVYDYIFTRAKRTFNANVEAGTVMKSYTTIFAQILRLRQSCCHPVLTRNKEIAAEEEEAANAADVANGLADDMDLQALIERFTAQENQDETTKFGSHVLKKIQAEAEDECPICSEEPMEDQAVTGCWHSACKKCLLDYIKHQRDKGEIPRCFNCREPINARDVFEAIRHEVPADQADDDSEGLYSLTPDATPALRISLRRVGGSGSAKIQALLSHLKKIRKQDPRAKSVVFSQFTSFLDIIEPALTHDHIPFLRFDGSMAQKLRASVLAQFEAAQNGTVLLLSLRAGGVGLNLTCARQVFMMDPWWSWAIEAQAIDRVHRMGQESEVKVTRFIVEGSIEEKMLRIQERKKFIASSLGMMSKDEQRSQRIEDLKELFS